MLLDKGIKTKNQFPSYLAAGNIAVPSKPGQTDKQTFAIIQQLRSEVKKTGRGRKSLLHENLQNSFATKNSHRQCAANIYIDNYIHNQRSSLKLQERYIKMEVVKKKEQKENKASFKKEADLYLKQQLSNLRFYVYTFMSFVA